MMPDFVLFRTDGNQEYGLGHFARCLSLASEARRRGARVAFALRFEGPALRAALSQAEIAYECVPEGIALEGEGEWLRVRFTPPQVLVFDVSHGFTLRRAREFGMLLSGLRSLDAVIAVLDGLRDQALVELAPLGADVVATPYVGAVEKVGAPYRHLAGPEYFVFHPDFLAARTERRFVADPRRLLLTCGGADPRAITLKALRALAVIRDLALEVRVVIGPCFSPELAQAARGLAAGLPHRVTLVEAPASLAELIAWSDVAISASGLTKYELAFMGCPSLLISPDDAHAAANVEFGRLGTAWHLGAHASVSEDDIVTALLRLLRDEGARERMSRLGRSLVDGGGAARIMKAIEEVRESRCSRAN